MIIKSVSSYLIPHISMVILSISVSHYLYIFVQGGLMNNIESNVCNAQEYVERAKEDTKAAVKVQKTSKVVSHAIVHSCYLKALSLFLFPPPSPLPPHLSCSRRCVCTLRER